MRKNQKTLLIVIVVLLIIGGLSLQYGKKQSATPMASLQSQDLASSITGCYVAHLNRDTYVLDIQSEENGQIAGLLTFNNYEKDSSSGQFAGTYENGILSGNYTFDSEGMRSERQIIFKRATGDFVEGFGPVTSIGARESFVNPSTVTYDPKTTFVKRDDCMEHYTYTNNTYSFDYNSLFTITRGDTTPLTNWKAKGTTSGMILGTLIVPKIYMPGTNFSDAKLTVGTSMDKNAVKNCEIDEGYIDNHQSITIAGIPFKKLSFGDAGAGNLYDTTSYRAVIDNTCYALEYTLHSTNLGAYSPDQGIQQFDKSKVTSELEQIIQSFKIHK